MLFGWFLAACAPTEAEAPVAGLRRLSIHEYDNTLRDVLGDDTRPGRALLPSDQLLPFDNDWTTHDPSLVLVEAAEQLATSVAERLTADPQRLQDLLPCRPTGPSDRACLDTFIATVGTRLLRRPMEDEHRARLGDVAIQFAIDERRFEAGIEIALRALLQDPGFLYRVELGTPVDGRPDVYVLDPFEYAARMAFLLWAAPPDAPLLAAAANGELEEPDKVQQQAERMLEDPRARVQLDRFHALWLGYHQLPHEPWLTTAMREETRALIDRVVFDDQRSWLELWTFQESWLQPALARHYGQAPSSEVPHWMPTPADRHGLLGTGSFLSAGGAVGDTSPTRRGKLVRERVFCDPVSPPPGGVVADSPPPADLAECKPERYAQHRNDASCAGCHQLMDPIGFGLEGFDRFGVPRTHEPDNRTCEIDGTGEVVPHGTFRGPSELGRLAVSAGVDSCAIEHLVHFALGHAPSSADEALHQRLLDAFRAPSKEGTTHRFDRVLVELITDPSFRLRRTPGSY